MRRNNLVSRQRPSAQVEQLLMVASGDRVARAPVANRGRRNTRRAFDCSGASKAINYVGSVHADNVNPLWGHCQTQIVSLALKMGSLRYEHVREA